MSSSVENIQSYLDSKIIEAIDKYDISRIVDFGCGVGDRLERIKSSCSKELDLYGVDVFGRWGDQEGIPKDRDGIKFIDKEKNELNQFIADKKCDLVITTFSLHHFRLPIQELKLMETMLADRGYLFIGDMSINNNSGSANENISSYVGDFLCSMRGQYHRHNYSLEEAQDLLRAINVNLLESNYHIVDHIDGSLREDAIKRIERLDKLIHKMEPEKYPSKEIFDLHILIREYMKGLFDKDYRAVAVSSAITLLAQKLSS